MPNRDAITWFKQQFGKKIDLAVRGDVFTTDMITAIACQETGEIWNVLRKKQLSIEKILQLCVGDTIDKSPTGGRSAFPKNKAELLSKPNGQQMFDIARQALLDMSQYITGYQRVAENPNKFCRGFGIFQFDLQFFLSEPDYFLQKQYADFDICLARCIHELHSAMRRIRYHDKTKLTDYEMAAVAIAYNTGTFRPALGLKQGYKSPQGKYYGEQFFDYLRLSQSISVGSDNAVTTVTPVNGVAIVPPPSPVEAPGEFYEVDVVSDPLRLRREPKSDPGNPTGNVIALLPDGHIVKAVTGKKVNGFLEVETSLQGGHHHGFASAKYLKLSATATHIDIDVPDPVPPKTGIVAVYMPRKQAFITKRTAPANAFSLNEQGQPGRNGNTADKLRNELAAIIEWLAVDKSTHLRYKPGNGLTYCNMYAHDYCFLAGVYLPRVWWSQDAIRGLSRGDVVEPVIGRTIDEQRANNLFRWLRDFGLEFGWRQTGTLTKLQTEVNQGAVGIIVARRKEDGKSGHIVAVVPETETWRAKRNAEGEVIAPLQSQAGSVNFRYGTGKLNWWRGEQFADSAFWIHP